jgi:hypothetical protein
MADDKLLQGPTIENQDKIVPVLKGYFQEADNARKGGLNPRDDKWTQNLHLYWSRFDNSKKAAWQAKEVLPEVPAFVDRFAAALKEALVTGPDGFYTIEDPADVEGDLTSAVKRMNDCWLSMTGRNQMGTCLGFPAVFEEQIKLGALMACSSVTRWDDSYGKYGRVAIETTDPRNVWLDPTYRNLYRIRRIELDKHELRSMALQKDKKGSPIYNMEAIDQMVSHIELDSERQKQDLTGHGAAQTSTRTPITMDEYLGTVVDSSGKVLAKDSLMVLGNGQFLIRGPEKNPYWHGRDWLTYSPLIITPLSVYGRTYMEDFGSLAQTLNMLTNLILDAVQMSTMKAYAVVPAMLSDPSQLAGGMTPNKLFHLEDGNRPEDFMKAIDLGNLGPDAMAVWQTIKKELTEAANQNEIGLGGFAPKGRTSATEISQTQESSSAVIRSIAQTVEARVLNPQLDLVWKTGLQHMNPNDPMLKAACGEDMFGVLMSRRRELASRPMTFQAHGISSMIQKSRMLKSLLQLMSFLSQSPELLGEFMKQVDLGKFIKLLFKLSDIDITKVTMSQREQLMQQTAQAFQAAQQQAMGAQGVPPGQGAPEAPGGAGPEMQQVVQSLGIGKG